jgi:hypothetical protein
MKDGGVHPKYSHLYYSDLVAEMAYSHTTTSYTIIAKSPPTSYTT